MKHLFDILFYGSVPEKHRHTVYAEIEEANRKSIISYSVISLAAFIAMTLYAILSQNAVSKNKAFYMLGLIIMLVMLILNLYPAKKYRRIIATSAYFFVITLLLIGILLAVSSKGDVTASYMVFLFVAPLLFILKPIYIIFIILGMNLFYICYMYQIQPPELFQKNIVNAVIYGILSIFVSTTMTRTRIQKFETDHINRILMETDQLTGMLNRRSFQQYVQQLVEIGEVTGIKVCAFDVNGLKQVNDHIGHHAGDELIRGAAACLENVFSHYGYCYRIGGDEFIAILPNESPSEEELMDMLNKQTTSFKGTFVPGLSISTGIVIGTSDDTITDLLRKADAKMYEYKAAYYRKCGINRKRNYDL